MGLVSFKAPWKFKTVICTTKTISNSSREKNYLLPCITNKHKVLCPASWISNQKAVFFQLLSLRSLLAWMQLSSQHCEYWAGGITALCRSSNHRLHRHGLESLSLSSVLATLDPRNSNVQNCFSVKWILFPYGETFKCIPHQELGVRYILDVKCYHQQDSHRNVHIELKSLMQILTPTKFWKLDLWGELAANQATTWPWPTVAHLKANSYLNYTGPCRVLFWSYLL